MRRKEVEWQQLKNGLHRMKELMKTQPIKPIKLKTQVTELLSYKHFYHYER